MPKDGDLMPLGVRRTSYGFGEIVRPGTRTNVGGSCPGTGSKRYCCITPTNRRNKAQRAKASPGQRRLPVKETHSFISATSHRDILTFDII